MITSGSQKFVAALKAMWTLCFPEDTEDFIDFYFNRVYKDEETLVYIIDNKPVAALQMIPFQLNVFGKPDNAAYLSGVMTHPDFRRHGIMKKLLSHSLAEMQKRGFSFVFLLPQEKWLTGFYKKFGFENLEIFIKRICAKKVSDCTSGITVGSPSEKNGWTLDDLLPDDASFEKNAMILPIK
jgi:predicted acetyltransferase